MKMLFNHGLHRLAALTLACLAFAFAAFATDPAITVSAKQRYPWNGLVDLHFTITGTSGTKYDTSFTAKDMVGNTNIAMRTIRKTDGSTANVAKEQLTPGTYNWVWDASADLPNGFQCERVTVTATVNKNNPLYMVIDLSGGANASSYPVSYLDAVPSGGWSDEYKTTKLVLRRIDPGTFTMGHSANDAYSKYHKVTLTAPFYIGVFEITQKQYEQITGSSPANLTGEMRPVESISYNTIRGSANGSKWPTSSSVDSSSFMGKMRALTGFQGCDLPTSAQWEYACRAGTTTALNSGLNTTGQYACTNLNKIARYFGNQGSFIGPEFGIKYDNKGGCKESTVVGLYEPNKWGLYDMHGNVWEMCLDWYSSLGTSAATNPQGPSSGSYRVIRGGDWYSAPHECVQGRHVEHYNYAYRDYYNKPSFSSNHLGFRLCVTFTE